MTVMWGTIKTRDEGLMKCEGRGTTVRCRSLGRGTQHQALPFRPSSLVPRSFRPRGFSLLEILIALAVLALALTGILSYFGGAQTMVRQAEALTTATMLGRSRMAEVVLDLEKRMAAGKFPDSDEHTEGKFEGRYEPYAWAVDIKRVKIPVGAASAGADAAGATGQPANAGGNIMSMFMQQLKLDEAVREVTLKITWKLREHERNFTVTTHVVKL